MNVIVEGAGCQGVFGLESLERFGVEGVFFSNPYCSAKRERETDFRTG